MKINGIDVDATLKKVATVLSEEKGLSPAIRSVVELLVLLITLLVSRLNLDSRNSSKPPSSDPNRKKVSRAKGDKKAGGQTRPHENGERLGVILKELEPFKKEIQGIL